jgi:hypothetical protein
MVNCELPQAETKYVFTKATTLLFRITEETLRPPWEVG